MRVDGFDRKGVGPSLALIYSSCTPRALQLLVLAAWTIFCKPRQGDPSSPAPCGFNRFNRFNRFILRSRPNAKDNAGSTGDEEEQN